MRETKVKVARRKNQEGVKRMIKEY